MISGSKAHSTHRVGLPLFRKILRNGVLIAPCGLITDIHVLSLVQPSSDAVESLPSKRRLSALAQNPSAFYIET